MTSPKDLQNMLNGLGGPVMQDTLKALKDPKTPPRDKVKLLATLVLPQFQQIKNKPEVAMMLPLLVTMGVAQAKGEFKALPKELLIAQIDQNLPKMEKETIVALLKAERAVAKQQLEEHTKAQSPDEKAEDAALQAYFEEVTTELTEDEYVSVALNMKTLLPNLLGEFLLNAEGHADYEGYVRQAYKDLKSGDLSSKNGNSDAFDKFFLSDDLLVAAAEVYSKVDAEKLYNLAEDIIDNIDDAALVTAVENGLKVVEESLLAAKKTGNPLQISNVAAADAFAKAVGSQLQVIEDAVVKADLLPDTPLKPLMADAVKQTREAMRRTPKP